MGTVASEKMTEPSSVSVSPSQSVEHTPSRRVSDAAVSDCSTDAAADRPFSLDQPPCTSKELDIQNQLFLRSEEYRQLFRLPPDEVLIQDFNCALQENFLLQGHMYLFAHYICFYSNLFGFETKKIIPIHEVTSVRRAKAAAIFPTAIEVIAGGKKYFFTSFLSRDEAFKIINDGWLPQSDGDRLTTEKQEFKDVLNSQENGTTIVEKSESSRQLLDERDLIERDKDCSTQDLDVPVDIEPEILCTANGPENNVEEDVEIVQSTVCSSSVKSLVWEQEESDAPGVPDCFTRVAESDFPVKVEEFFHYFFSDDAVDFQDSFHRKCGDKDFRCTKWCSQEKSGFIRDVSFQHPIKLYLGARFGSCREVQKYRVYQNSHLVFETSQEISDVPYGDYFSVEGLWHVERYGDGSKAGCTVRVYTNVNFSKKTMFKGKIVQSTVDECRDAYATWIELAHELLKLRSLEIEETSDGPTSNLITNLMANNESPLEEQRQTIESPENSNKATTSNVPRPLPNSEDVNQVIDSLRGSYNGATSVTSLCRDSLLKLFSSLKSQSHISLLLVIGITVILLLMQISILVLLSRPQQIHVIPQADFTYGGSRGASERGGEIALLDKQIKHLREEMHMVETLLGKMQNEHALLKFKLEDLELVRKRQR